MRTHEVLDRTFSIVVSGSHDAGDEFERVFAELPGAQATEGTSEYVLSRRRTTFVLSRDGQVLATAAAPDSLVDILVWSVNQTLAHRSGLLLLHGAAVERDGKAVLLPGASGAGKSTLAAAMVAAGWNLLSDELIAVDCATGLVHGTKLPINLKRGSWFLLPEGRITDRVERKPSGQVLVQPSELGGHHADRPCRPAAIIAPSYDATTPVRLTPISRGACVLSLVEGCLNPRVLDLEGLAGLTSGVRTGALSYDSPTEAASLLGRVLDGSART